MPTKENRFFFSNSGKISLEELGIEDGDVINVGSNLAQENNTGRIAPNNPNINSLPNRNINGPRKNVPRVKSKGSTTVFSMGRGTKEEHKQALFCVLDKMKDHPWFKGIRKKLTDASLRRSDKNKRQPKSSSEGKVNTPNASLPAEDFLGGEAGRTVYPVLVSENGKYMYKTSKRTSSYQILSIDLHGCSKNEALEKVEQELAELG